MNEKDMKIMLLLLLFGLVSIPNSFAITYPDDDYKILGRTLTHSPTVCAFEPETDIKDAWEMLSKYTRGPIIDWENKLNQHTKNKDAWNIELQLISIEKQSKDLDCDITISYHPKPEKEREFEIAGVTFRNGLNNQDIIIYYLNIELERTDYTVSADDPGYYYSVVEFTPRYTDYLASESNLRMTIKHEIGHALGLGHYITQDKDRFQRWYDGIERPPSVMIPMKPTKIISTDITPLDVEKLVGIYGRNGYFSETISNDKAESLSEVRLPHWIRNNAKWWSEGNITDRDFATGIEFMIKEEIIQLKAIETSQFTVEQIIPEWLKLNAKWWSAGLIPDQEFVDCLEFLIHKGIIRV